jgi:transcriptional regulator with XRE-family HTH domain
MYYKMNIKYLREKYGASQKRVAVDLGLSRTVLGGYESGVTQPPLDKLQLIADYFEVPIEALLHRDLSKEGDFKVAESPGMSKVEEPPARYGDPENEQILIRQIGQLQREVDTLREQVKKLAPGSYEGDETDN